jgi:hypothetical protein
MHWCDVPSHKRNTFMNAVKSLAEWTTLFNDTLCKLEVKDPAMQEDDDVDKDEIFNEDPLLPNDPPSCDHLGQCKEIQFSWDLGKDNAPWGSPSPAHRAALQLLQSTYDKHAARLWEQEEALREIYMDFQDKMVPNTRSAETQELHLQSTQANVGGQTSPQVVTQSFVSCFVCMSALKER